MRARERCVRAVAHENPAHSVIAYVHLALLLLLGAVLLRPCLASEVLVVRNLTPKSTNAAPEFTNAAPVCDTHAVTLKHGVTLSGVLSKLHVPQSQVLSWAHRLPHGYRASDLRSGDRILACLGGDHARHDLVGLKIIGHHGHQVAIGHFPTYVKTKSEKTKTAKALAVSFTPPSLPRRIGSLRHVSFRLNGSLSHALAAHHLSVAETNAIQAWVHTDADLKTTMPAGARISLLLGRKPGDQAERLLRLRIRYHGKTHELYSYVDKNHRRWELDRAGYGILHVNLKTPVDYTRISSGWGWREQPVLHVPEFHKGIDYAAPMGTPVHAAASGIVKLSGWHGNYGRLLIVQNTADMQTRYGHLSRMARGIHDGSHVHAGQVIGYVGSTGLSTGPHLYFELWIHGLRVDPLTTKVNLPVQLAGPVLHDFKHYVSRIDDLGPMLADAG